jgi:uncharacterized protein (DUF1684 family)
MTGRWARKEEKGSYFGRMKMMRALLLFCLMNMSVPLFAQTGAGEDKQNLIEWQHHYKKELNDDARSPVHGKDTSLIRFFPIDVKWRCTATVNLTPEAKPFKMATHSGKVKQYRSYATLNFRAPGQGKKEFVLHVYERVDVPANDTFGDYLFLPFQDLTNNVTSYGGGRYIDVSRASLGEGIYWLDFNKAYNPYCAFGGNYACPIPPEENKMKIEVKAGEALPEAPLGKE